MPEDVFSDMEEENEPSNDNWQCGTCGEHNEAIFGTCRQCSSARPTAAAAKGNKDAEDSDAPTDHEDKAWEWELVQCLREEMNSEEMRGAPLLLQDIEGEEETERALGEAAEALVAAEPADSEDHVFCRKRNRRKGPERRAPVANGTDGGQGGNEEEGGDAEAPVPKPRRQRKARAKAKVVAKKPAKREPFPNELCHGCDGVICQFATTVDRLGDRALTAPQRKETRCVFCDPQRMAQAFTNTRRKGVVTNALRFFKDQGREDIYAAAIAKVPEAERDRITAALNMFLTSATGFLLKFKCCHEPNAVQGGAPITQTGR